MLLQISSLPASLRLHLVYIEPFFFSKPLAHVPQVAQMLSLCSLTPQQQILTLCPEMKTSPPGALLNPWHSCRRWCRCCRSLAA